MFSNEINRTSNLFNFDDPYINDLLPNIFLNLKQELPTIAFVCKKWKNVVDHKVFREKIFPAQANGIQVWKEYFNVDPGNEIPLPRRAYGDLEKEGGLLTFIPEKILIIQRGIGLDKLNTIEKIMIMQIKGYQIESIIKYAYLVENERKKEKAHWVWIKPELLGKGKDYTQQCELVKAENEKIKGARISDAIDTMISMTMEYVKSGKQYFSDRMENVRTNDNGKEFPNTRICLTFENRALSIQENPDYAYGNVGVVVARKSF